MSITRYPEADDANLAIPAGDVAGQTSVNKFGRNTSVGTGGEDIWDGGGTWVAPTQARQHEFASASALDVLSGSGAWSIQIYGLKDWNTKEHSEVINLNGTTAVTSSAAYVILHRMKVTAAGNDGPNDGTISAVAQIDTTITAQINAGQGQTQMAIYGIPSVQTAYMTGFYGSILGNANVGANLEVLFNPNPDEPSATGAPSYLIKHSIGIVNTGATNVQHEYSPYNGFSGPGIFKMKGTPSGAADMSAGFDLILKDNA